MEKVKCNLCGSDDYRLIYKMPDTFYFKDEWFNIVECNDCGLGYINPRPAAEDMGRYYPESFYDYFNTEKEFHLKRYSNEAKYLKYCKTGNKLLDIGCANGDFPRYVKKLGWQVEGVEVSPNTAPIYDFPVYYCDFTKIPIQQSLYDVITAWAVLEHVHDPFSYFKKAAEILKPNGIFIFLVTNFNSISSKYLFREDIPRHLYFFTPSTIKEYLLRTGFETIDIDFSNNVYSMRPVNWLRFYFYRLLGKSFNFKDIPLNRFDYFDKYRLTNNLVSNIKYVSNAPFTFFDRLLMPIYEQFQLISNTYGIVTYVVKKL